MHRGGDEDGERGARTPSRHRPEPFRRGRPARHDGPGHLHDRGWLAIRGSSTRVEHGEPSRRREMLKRTVLGAALAVALAAAGVAAAAAVTHQSSAASNATAGKVTLHKTKIGKVLATSSGRTLYLFMKDRHGKSSCYGQCATYWPPLMKKGALRAGPGVKAGLLGTTKRKNGKLQVKYNGHPLYLFKLDKGAGQI